MKFLFLSVMITLSVLAQNPVAGPNVPSSGGGSTVPANATTPVVQTTICTLGGLLFSGAGLNDASLPLGGLCDNKTTTAYTVAIDGLNTAGPALVADPTFQTPSIWQTDSVGLFVISTGHAVYTDGMGTGWCGMGNCDEFFPDPSSTVVTVGNTYTFSYTVAASSGTGNLSCVIFANPVNNSGGVALNLAPGSHSVTFVFGGHEGTASAVPDLGCTSTGASSIDFTNVQVKQVGDTFKWKAGSGSFTTGVLITTLPETLSNEVAIAFAAATGHTLSDQWTMTASVSTQLLPDTSGGVNLQWPPFYASGSAVTTTTSGTVAPGNTVTVVDGSSFVAGEGVYIAGAGAAAGNYVGTISAVNGNVLTLNTATSTSVTDAVVMHDETNAFQSFMNSSTLTGGRAFLGCGTYNLNGPLQNTMTENAIVMLPENALDTLVLEVDGETAPGGSSKCVNIVTLGDSGNLISGYGPNSSSNFTYLAVTLKNLNFIAPQNPQITILNAANVHELMLDNITATVAGFDLVSSNPTTPTHANGQGIIFPKSNNSAVISGHNLNVFGYYNAFTVSEHADLTGTIQSYVSACGVVVNSGTHINHIGKLTIQGATNAICSGDGTSLIEIDSLDADAYPRGGSVSNIVLDPMNQLLGRIRVSNSGYTVASGGTGLDIQSFPPFAPVSVSGCGATAFGTGSTNESGTITGVTTTGACSALVVTFSGNAAPNAWRCSFTNLTTGNLIRQTAGDGTTVTAAGATLSGDVIQFNGCSRQ